VLASGRPTAGSGPLQLGFTPASNLLSSWWKNVEKCASPEIKLID